LIDPSVWVEHDGKFVAAHAGGKVPVTEDVYRAYYRPVWREAKQKEVRDDMEYSLDALEDFGYEAVSDGKLVDEIVADKLLLDELYAALDELTDDERSLIDSVYLNSPAGCSEWSAAMPSAKEPRS
jgi:hypothetical protein